MGLRVRLPWGYTTDGSEEEWVGRAKPASLQAGMGSVAQISLTLRGGCPENASPEAVREAGSSRSHHTEEVPHWAVASGC